MGGLRHALTAWGIATILVGVAGATTRPIRAAEAEQQKQPADEYRVKAAMLLNFAKFVEWPSGAFSAPTTPLTVCVIGVDPFGSVIDEAFTGRIGGRPVITRRLMDVEPGCHLLFISGSERKRMAFIADRLKLAGVLTVSDDEGFGAVGGMIELFTQAQSVQFNIYPNAVEQSGLRASSRLIALAANQRHAAGARR